MKWKTKDGRELTPQEMDTEHIFNTCKLIIRKCQMVSSQQVVGMVCLPTEIPDEVLEDIFESNWEDEAPPIYYALYDELVNRDSNYIEAIDRYSEKWIEIGRHAELQAVLSKLEKK